MKNYLIQFLIRISIISIILQIISIVVNRYFFELNIVLLSASILYFFIISLFLVYYNLNSLIKNKKKFPLRLMVSIAIKLFFSFILFAVLAITNKEQIKTITIWFLILYITYHINYITTLNRINKKNVE